LAVYRIDDVVIAQPAGISLCDCREVRKMFRQVELVGNQLLEFRIGLAVTTRRKQGVDEEEMRNVVFLTLEPGARPAFDFVPIPLAGQLDEGVESLCVHDA